jgi:hypothetical protein
MTTERERHVTELVKRSGLVEQLEREDEQTRAAAFEAARLRKKAAFDRYLIERPKAEARVSAADERCQAARKAFEATVADLAKASQGLDQVRGEFDALRGQVDAELRKHSDPRVEALKVELQRRRADGTLRGTYETHEDRSRAARGLSALIDEVDRIRVAGEPGDITDVPAALEDVRRRLP